MKVLLSILSLPPLLLIHNVLGKPAELLDLYFDLAPAAANGSSTKIEARTEEAQEGGEGGKQTNVASLTLDGLLQTFSTSSLNDALSTNALSNLVSKQN